MGYYKDLGEYIQALESKNLLWRISDSVVKDTELMPVVRWQFRGLSEKQRRAFLFENVTDIKGKKYDGSVLVGAHAASGAVYAMALMCKPEELMEKWRQAQLHPIEPKIVKSGPVQEEIHMGDSLLEHGGLEEFPVPISTPGFDNAPYFSAGNWVSKDPDTGIRNSGTYRGMVKSSLKVGCWCDVRQHMRIHREKYKAKGKSTMPAAIVVGETPNIGIVSATSIPFGIDEYAIAGGISGEAVELVKCKTVDIEVPSTAQIVIEGEIPTDYLEREGPFGEYHGYIGRGRPSLFLNVTCITHRKKPIFNSFISQLPPSESSTLKRFSWASTMYKFLKYDVGISTVQEVALQDMSGSSAFCVIQLKGANKQQVWQALNAAAARSTAEGKIFVAVDDDIDPHDLESVIWALSFRMQPERDVRITPNRVGPLDPSTMAPQELEKMKGSPPASALLIDATRKWAYPPVSLPKKEYMEHARKLWEKWGLPPLTPRTPWYGYSLGYWTKEDEEEAELALKGEHYKTGEKLAQKRIEG
jgi:UbiD family decarboxylase